MTFCLLLRALANVLLRSDFTGFECEALLDGESGMEIMADMSDGPQRVS